MIDADDLFERYALSAAGGGALDRTGFRQLIRDLQPHATVSSGHDTWGAPVPLGVSGMSPYGRGSSAPHPPVAADAALGAAAAARAAAMRTLSDELLALRGAWGAAAARRRSAMAAVRSRRAVIERETVADAQGVMHRLRSAEAAALVTLQADVDRLVEAAGAVDEFHAALASYSLPPLQQQQQLLRDDYGGGGGGWALGGPPRLDSELRGPGAVAVGAVGLRQLEFVRAYPELAARAEAISNMTVPWDAVGGGAPEPYLDLPRETATRLATLARYNEMVDALAARDAEIARLHRAAAATQAVAVAEGARAAAHVTRLSGCVCVRVRVRVRMCVCAYANRRMTFLSLARARRTLERASTALEGLALECEFCCTPLGRDTVNEACPFAAHAAAVGARGGGGGDRSARHYFVTARRRASDGSGGGAVVVATKPDVPARAPLGTLRL